MQFYVTTLLPVNVNLMSKLAILEILRPKQWYKNFLLFVPLVFSLNLFDSHSVLVSLLGFFILCLSSSGSYVINDLIDFKRDSLHPEKAKRPIPSGRVSRRLAIPLSICLLAASEILSHQLGISFLITNSTLIVLTLIYSLHAKNIFLLDIFLISINYVLRAVSGAFALEIKISPWLIMGVFFLALLLALAKRKNEILFLKDNAVEHRKILKEYSNDILNYSIGVTSATIILAYSIYSMTGPASVNDWRLVLTIPVAFFIMILFIDKTYKGTYSGKELNNLLAKDKKLVGGVLFFIIFVIFLLYVAPPIYFK